MAAQCTVLVIVRCAVCSVQCAVYSVLCSVFRMRSVVCSVKCILQRCKLRVYRVQGSVCSAPWEMCSVKRIVCSLVFAVCSVQQGSRKIGAVGTCSQPIWDFGSYFWLASWNSFRNKCQPVKMSYRNEECQQNRSKSPKKMHKKHGNRDN